MNSSIANGGGRSIFVGFTRLSKALTGVVVVVSIPGFFFKASLSYLALVPAKTIPCVWMLITAGCVEQHIVSLLANVAALLLIGRFLEPIWGSKEFLKFVLVINFIVSSCTFVLMFILYLFTMNETFLYSEISGLHGVIAGLLVAMKQLMPEQEITLLYILKFRAKWVPSLFVLTAVVLGILGGEVVLYVPYIVHGTYCSWVYLRFFQRKPEGNLKGDPSEEFAFVTFFPEILRPVLRPIANICAKLFCSLRSQAADDDNSFALGGKPLPGSDAIEANRRRERGARALEQRLKASSEPVAPLESKARTTGGATLPLSTKPSESPDVDATEESV